MHQSSQESVHMRQRVIVLRESVNNDADKFKDADLVVLCVEL